MSEALEIAELEGQNSNANIVDILDYLAFSTGQVHKKLFELISYPIFYIFVFYH